MRNVVVTGVGVAAPLGLGASAFWESLCAGKCGMATIKQFDPSGFDCTIGGEVPPYRITDSVPKNYRKAAKLMARDIELAVLAADDAVKDSGLKTKASTETPDVDLARFGCNIGAGLICCDLNELAGAMDVARDGTKLDLKKWGREGMAQLTPLWLLKYLPNMLACHVTIIHGLRGPSNTITCSDASSHLAIGEAFRTIQRGDSDVAICGGAESKVNPMALVRQHLLKRVNTQSNQAPEQAVRPFNETASGTVVAEGAGLLILEAEEHAKARGAKIYARVLGFGAAQDTTSVTDLDPTGHSYGRAIHRALVGAGVAEDGVDLVIPHGVGIAAHDRAEWAGLLGALGEQAEKAYIAPIKGQTGNMAAGSGVDAAAAVLAIHHGMVPPAVNVNPEFAGHKLNVSAKARTAEVKTALSCAYSVGGQIGALLFGKA